MEFGWIILIGFFTILAVIGKCGELYYNSSRQMCTNKVDDDNTNLLNYNGV